LKKIISFIVFLRHHQIDLNPRHWYRGVLLLVTGWGILGVNSIYYPGNLNAISTSISFIIQFSSGIVFLLLLYFFQSIIMREKVNIKRFMSFSKENDISKESILSVRKRMWLVYIRGFLAGSGYIGFQLAKASIGSIDNSILYGSDALIYAIISFIVLKDRYNTKEILGILIAFSGVGGILLIDALSETKILALSGAALGLFSSLSLSFILILTTIIVQHDRPISVAFHQCIAGLLIAILILIIEFNKIPNLVMSTYEFYNSVIQGILYALALVFFLKSFHYVTVIVVAASSYFLDIFVILLESFRFSELPSVKNIISMILISVGTGILIYEENKKIKSSRRNIH